MSRIKQHVNSRPFSRSRISAALPDRSVISRIPYTAHVSPFVVATRYGHYVQVFRLAGVSFESADDEQLNNWHARLNVLWRSIASPHVALWTHLIRRRILNHPPVKAQGAFASRLHQRYCARMAAERLMVNELYLSVVYRPTAGIAADWTAKLLSRTHEHAVALELADALESCEKLRETLRATLERYEAEPLRVYSRGPHSCSQVLEFFGLLIHGEWQPRLLPRGPLNEALGASRPIIGLETIEYRLPTQTQLSAMLGISEYPKSTAPGMLNGLLKTSFPFVLTQSFSFFAKSAAQGLLLRQYNKLKSSGDFAISQAEELRVALDELSGGEFVMGDHHFSLQVMADPFEAVAEAEGTWRLKTLNDRIAEARSLLIDCDLAVCREDLGLEAAFWAQLPGEFRWRPRLAAITSRNFAGLAPFHNYPCGRASGNHWGDALAVLTTNAHSPYYFSLHASDMREADGGSRRDTGHTFIVGPTGGGKTVLIGFLAAMLSQHHTTQVIFDKDHGLEIFVRAQGGIYLPLANGLPTGFNPLQLPEEPHHVEFLKVWLRQLAQAGSASSSLSVGEEADLDQALRGALALPHSARCLSRLVEFLDATEPEGLYARLARWCASTQGEYAWVFDNETDSVGARLQGQSFIGFEVSDFLAHPVTCTPITLYLLHLVRGLLGCGRLVCWMEEFWRLLQDPVFLKFAEEGPKTWRKLDALMCMATQSPSDVLLSPIARTIIEQTATKIYLPNPEANSSDYIQGFGLTQREFALIKEELEPGSRRFLVKQGHYSIVCELDLRGFDAEIAVISGRPSAIEFMNRLIERTGSAPSDWLPLFLAARGQRELTASPAKA
jgi:type IV secretion system protein VirB4